MDWDAVCVPASLASGVLAALDEDTGAVIHDRFCRQAYWLIEPHAAEHWRLPDDAGVRVLGRGSWVGVPPVDDRYAAARWERPVADRRLLTPATSLHAALQVAIAEAVPR